MREGLLTPLEAIQAIREEERKKKGASTSQPLPLPRIDAGRVALGLPAVRNNTPARTAPARGAAVGDGAEALRMESRALRQRAQGVPLEETVARDMAREEENRQHQLEAARQKEQELARERETARRRRESLKEIEAEQEKNRAWMRQLQQEQRQTEEARGDPVAVAREKLAALRAEPDPARGLGALEDMVYQGYPEEQAERARAHLQKREEDQRAKLRTAAEELARAQQEAYAQERTERVRDLEREAGRLGKPPEDWSAHKWSTFFPSEGELIAQTVALENPYYDEKKFGGIKYLTEEEKGVIKAFAAAGEYEKAGEYYRAIEQDLNERSFQDAARAMQEMPGAGGTVVRAVLPVAANLTAPLAYGEAVLAGGKELMTGKYAPPDLNAGAMATVRLGNMAQQRTVEDLERVVEEKTGSKLAAGTAGFLTDTGYSILNNAVNLGWGPGMSLAVMGLQSAGQSTVGALEKGATTKQALTTGTLSGSIEIITEKLPMDNLWRLIGDGGKRTTGQAVKEVLQQMGIEASEEVVGSYLDTLNDVVVMGEKSDYARYKAELVAEGYSEAEAARLANQQFFVVEPLKAGLGGAISGGVMAGVPVAAHQVGNARTDSAIDRAYSAMGEHGMFSAEAGAAMQAADRRLGPRGLYAPGVTEAEEAAPPPGLPAGAEKSAPAGTEAQGETVNKADGREVVVKVRESIPGMQDMDAVSTLTGEEFAKSGGKLTEQVGAFFRNLGNRVFRRGLGEVLLDERGVKSDIAHGLGRAKAITFAAVPDVIRDGVQIDYQENWKGRGYDTYVFAAPVDLGGQRAYMGVVVRRDQQNRFYLHEVVDGEGNIIYKKDAPQTIKTGVTVQDGVTGGMGASSEAIIAPELPRGKGQDMKNAPVETEAFGLPTASETNAVSQLRPDGSEAAAGGISTVPSLTEKVKGSVAEELTRRGGYATTGQLQQFLKTAFGQEAEAATGALLDGIDRGEYGVTAKGEIYARDTGSHIDQRDMKAVGSRGIKSFQYENPELHEHFVSAARALAEDLSNSTKGERWSTESVNPDTGAVETKWTGAKRSTTEQIVRLLDDVDLSYDQIRKAIDNIIQDQGQENYAAAKRVELVLDDMLTHGWTDATGRWNEPNGAYIADKARIPGGKGYQEPGAAQGAEAAPREAGGMDDAYWESIFRDEPLPHDESSVDGYWDELLGYIDRQIGPDDTKTAEVSTERAPRNQTAREKADEAWSAFKRKMVDSGDTVARVGKITGDKGLYHYYNFARAASSAADSMIRPKGAQTDIAGHAVGVSLADLWEPIRAKGAEYYRAFEDYLFHQHNVDRMSLDRNREAVTAEEHRLAFLEQHPEFGFETEDRLKRTAAFEGPDSFLAAEYLELVQAVNRAERAHNKPVFGWTVTADQSRDEAARYEREHPEFRELAEQVYQYSKNLMQYRVDSGLLTQEQADTIQSMYPHYVPTYRDAEAEGPVGRDEKNSRVGKTVGRAEGGNDRLMPLHVAMARQTMQVVREGSKNRFGLRLLENMRKGKGEVSRFVRGAEEYAAGFSADTFDDLFDSTPQVSNTFTVYQDGKQVVMQLDPGLYEGIQALSPGPAESNALTRSIRAANDLFKKLVTGYNPMFLARNFARDLQDAGLYSKDAAAFAKAYPEAVKEIATGGAYWRQYQALGGTFSSVFDYEQGYTTKKDRNFVERNVVDRMEALNMAIEQAPRLAEFMATVKKGDGSMDSLMEGMYNAADVTVNFGRSGTVGKGLNQNFVPFLNPGIQGFDKMVRRVTETHGGREWAKLAVRASLLGIAPAVLNALLYKDDEEWEDIRDSDKDVSYLFKLGEGAWLKIPKGRTLSILGMGASRALDLLRGDEVDWPEVIRTAANQVAPANPLENNILAAWMDADLLDADSPGRTWYGSDIEGQRLQGYRPGERYDENTDAFSKWLGGVLNLSPKKIHYLLDQYSGVVGDFVLPLMTPSGNKNPLSPFKSAFVLDSVSSNKISGEFYDMADEITYAKNGGQPEMAVVGRFWNKQAGAVSDIYAQIREIENDASLSNKEKMEQVREAKAVLNGIQKNALEVLPRYQEAVEKYYTGDSDKEMDRTYREANREVFGAEYALQVYDKDVYTTAVGVHRGGIAYDDFYNTYFKLQSVKGSGEGQTDRQRAALVEMKGLTDKEKAALGVAILHDSRTLDYSSAPALAISLMSESMRGKADAARAAEIEDDIFVAAYNAQKNVKGDKDANGNTVSLSASKKKKAAIDAATPGLTQAQRRILYEIFGVSEKVWGYTTIITGGQSSGGAPGLPTGAGEVEIKPVLPLGGARELPTGHEEMEAVPVLPTGLLTGGAWGLLR